MKRSPWVNIIASLFILLFVYTATSKFLDFYSFKSVLKDSPLIRNMSTFVAWGLPLVEIVIALLLFFIKTRRIGLWSSLLIMILFTVYLGYMIYFTPHLPCNCGGVLKEMTWKQHFVFNIFFSALAAFAIWKDKRENSNKTSNVGYKTA